MAFLTRRTVRVYASGVRAVAAHEEFGVTRPTIRATSDLPAQAIRALPAHPRDDSARQRAGAR
jgi:hypothetical protein